MRQLEVIIYDSTEDIESDERLIWQEIVNDFDFELFDEGCYAKDFDQNNKTNQLALPIKKYYENQIIAAIGLDKYNTKTTISTSDPDWFVQQK